MNQKVGFIGGGQMTQALVSGALSANVLHSHNLMISQPSDATRARLSELFPGVELVCDNNQVLEKCGIIVLAVKPHILKRIAPDLVTRITKQHLLVSIAAGISLEDLKTMFQSQRIVRVMPNTPSRVGMGAAGISATNDAAEKDIVWVETLLNAVGISVRVDDSLMHAVTGVAGSSPAYIYMVIEALSDGGVAMGLPRPVAVKLAAQAVAGAAQMVIETGQHPGQLKDQVTSPGGTTIAALRELETHGVRSAFIEAVAKCVERSREMQ